MYAIKNDQICNPILMLQRADGECGGSVEQSEQREASDAEQCRRSAAALRQTRQHRSTGR